MQTCSINTNKNVLKQSPKVDCNYCGRTVQKYGLTRHQQSKACLAAQGECSTTTCSACGKSVSSGYLQRHKCAVTKKKPVSKTKNTVINNTQNNDNRQYITLNVVNNNVLNITPEMLKGIVDGFTRDTLVGGGEALANLTLEQLPDGSITCSDQSRGKLWYVLDGKKCVDIKGKHLAATMLGAVEPKALELRREAEATCDNYIGVVCAKNHTAIKHKKGRYVTDFTGHVARSCVPDAPKSLQATDSPRSVVSTETSGSVDTDRMTRYVELGPTPESIVASYSAIRAKYAESMATVETLDSADSDYDFDLGVSVA